MKGAKSKIIDTQLMLVLAMVPVLDQTGFIGLCGKSLITSKNDDCLSASSHLGYKNWSESLVFGK
jgi:hypothetical protein